MTDPMQNWEAAAKYQRDLEPGELEELNRLRAWKEQQEREAQTRQLQEHQQRLAHEEYQRRLAEQQRHQYAAYQQAPPQYGVPNPQYAPIQQVTVHNAPTRPQCPHMLHFILTLISCGMWLPVWIVHAIYVASKS